MSKDITKRLEQAIENDVDYADPELRETLEEALEEIKRLRKRLEGGEVS